MTEPGFIPVAAPVLDGNEKEYVLDCLESTWISSSGKYLDRFEEAFAEFCGVKHAVSCSNGTTALHLALLALGVGPGDEVIVPTLTFVATANAVTYCGARPVFVDVEPETWSIDPAAIEAKITPRTKGIIAVHLFGHPADMDAIGAIARRHGLFLLEDAAQAHGARVAGPADRVPGRHRDLQLLRQQDRHDRRGRDGDDRTTMRWRGACACSARTAWTRRGATGIQSSATTTG